MTDTIADSVADFEPIQGASIWIFGYGSLVWRPAFQFVQTYAFRIRSSLFNHNTIQFSHF